VWRWIINIPTKIVSNIIEMGAVTNMMLKIFENTADKFNVAGICVFTSGSDVQKWSMIGYS
jgi:hypothetical protein